FNEQIYYCDLLIAVLIDREDNHLRQQIINLGIIDSLLKTFTTRDVRNITGSYPQVIYNILDNSQNNIRQQIFCKKPYQGLFRLIEAPDEEVVEQSLRTITEMLKYGIGSTKSVNDTNPHSKQVNQCDGFGKLQQILIRSKNPMVLHFAALSIGLLHKGKNIENTELGKKVILLLKMGLKKINDKKIQDDTETVLEILKENPANRQLIEYVMRSFPQLYVDDSDNEQDG
ncbi:MAG: hypothetical protein EZS28_044694, partial [Streblomastix strix]